MPRVDYIAVTVTYYKSRREVKKIMLSTDVTIAVAAASFILGVACGVKANKTFLSNLIQQISVFTSLVAIVYFITMVD